MNSASKPASIPKRKANTAEAILDVAEMLIQTRGYSAFSYQDVSDALGITKASIHYHFSTKSEMGIVVIDRYAKRFGDALDAFSSDSTKSTMMMFDFYTEPYFQFARTADRVCLCAALSGEVMALSPEIRERVDRFFKSHHLWLAGILERGRKRGEFRLSAPAAKMARLVFGALQGALLVQRTTGDMTQLNDVVAVLKSQLAADRRKAL